jgi:probable HAF family extracellular repeat protein
VTRSVLLIVTLCTIILITASGGYAGIASFQGLGDLTGGSYNSVANAVSADGMVVVGQSNSASGGEAFRWTTDGGMVGLGILYDTNSTATGVSTDGSVVVGSSGSTASSTFSEAFRWTTDGGMIGLGGLPGSGISNARDVSADGLVVVGEGPSDNSDYNRSEAFRWTANDGMVGLGFMSAQRHGSGSIATSGDGSVVVGNGRLGLFDTQAFRWTAASGMVGLGFLPGSGVPGSGRVSASRATSVDGSVVVGDSRSGSGIEAFRWTASSGMVGLGDLPGGDYISRGNAVSGDGQVIAGEGTTASGSEAFLWTVGAGIRSLKDVLTTEFGLDLTGWQLHQATGISADGLTIVGTGNNPDGFQEGWITTLAYRIPLVGDLDDDGFVGIEDLNLVLGNWNQNVPPGNPVADPSGDGFVGITDLGFVLGNWNAGMPPGETSNIPEPVSALLITLGSPVLLRRHTSYCTHT